MTDAVSAITAALAQLEQSVASATAALDALRAQGTRHFVRSPLALVAWQEEAKQPVAALNGLLDRDAGGLEWCTADGQVRLRLALDFAKFDACPSSRVYDDLVAGVSITRVEHGRYRLGPSGWTREERAPDDALRLWPRAWPVRPGGDMQLIRSCIAQRLGDGGGRHADARGDAQAPAPGAHRLGRGGGPETPACVLRAI
jgi:hypothetical protein